MVNCSSLNCCVECVESCIWGQAYRTAAICVDTASKIGRFIYIEVHPGQNCLIPGLDQGLCMDPTTVSPDPIKTGSYIGVISSLGVLLLIVSLGFIFYYIKYRRSNSAVLGLDNLNYGGWAEPDPEVREEERAAPNHYSADPISPMQIAMQSFSEDQLSSSTGSPRHFPSLRDSSDEEIEFSVFSTPSPRH